MGMLGFALQGLGQGIGTIGNAAMVGAQEQQRTAARRLERAEDFEREKQMMLERIRASEESAARMRQAELDFSTDPANVGKRTAAADTTARAAATTQDQIGIERANNPALQQAAKDTALRDAENKGRAKVAEGMITAPFLRQQMVDDANAKLPLDVARESAVTGAREEAQTKAMADRLPLEVKRATELATAQAKTAARYRDKPATISDKVAETEKALGRPLTEQEKMGVLGLLKGRDPELDTVTVKKKVVDPTTGAETETTSKEVRRPGKSGAATESADPIKAALEANRAKKAEATKPAADKPAARPTAQDTRPAVSGIDQGIMVDIAPLVEQYKVAKQQMAAAAKSGDPRAAATYAQALQQASDRLQAEANNRLGNGAQRFLAGVL